MRTLRLAAGALACLALAGCESESASYMIDGRDHALTLIREVPWWWSERAELSLVVTRLPECQRRHPLKPAALGARIQVYQLADRGYLLHQGKNWYAVDAQACTVAVQDAPAADPPGELIGQFLRTDNMLRFVAAEPQPKPISPSPPG